MNPGPGTWPPAQRGGTQGPVDEHPDSDVDRSSSRCRSPSHGARYDRCTPGHATRNRTQVTVPTPARGPGRTRACPWAPLVRRPRCRRDEVGRPHRRLPSPLHLCPCAPTRPQRQASYPPLPHDPRLPTVTVVVRTGVPRLLPTPYWPSSLEDRVGRAGRVPPSFTRRNLFPDPVRRTVGPSPSRCPKQ